MAKERQPDASVEKLRSALEKAEASSERGGRFADVGWDQLHEIVQNFIANLYAESIHESQRGGAQVVTDADVRRANENLIRNQKKTRRILSSVAGLIGGAAASGALSYLFRDNINPFIVALLFLIALVGVVIMVWGLVSCFFAGACNYLENTSLTDTEGRQKGGFFLR